MDLQLEYKIKEYGLPTPLTWTVADDTDLNSDFQKLEFEAIHNDYEDLLISGSLPFEINGNLFNAVYSYLVAHDYKAVNSIECRLKVVDTACGCDDYLNLYGVIRAIDVGDICIEDSKFKDCFKIKIKFERKEAELLKITLIDTDKKTNPNAVFDDFATPNIPFAPHPELKYISLDGLGGYKNLLWTNLFIGGAATATVAGLAVAGGGGVIAVAIYTALFITLALIVVILPDYVAERGAQNVIISPRLSSYIYNLFASSGLAAVNDTVVSAPSKLASLSSFVFANTNGTVHDANREFAYLSWTGEQFLKFVNKNFEAKWRLINNELHIRHKEQDYLNTTFFDMRGLDYCIENNTDLSWAAAKYEYTDDGSESEGTRRTAAYSDTISFTGNTVSDTQKGMLNEVFEPAASAFRFDGLAPDKVEAVDNLFLSPAIGIFWGIYSPFVTFGGAFALGNSDTDYLLLSTRYTESPKLICVDEADTSKAVNRPMTAQDQVLFEAKGYDPVNLTQPSRRVYNYPVFCDADFNAIDQNVYSLQNDDPRITKPEGIRTYEIPLNCSTLDIFGFLQSSAFDTAIDFFVDITNLDGSDGVGEIRSIVVNFKEGKRYVKVKRVNYV